MAEPLAIIVLPCALEEFEFDAHARELLEIARVLALEPRRAGVPGMVSEVTAFGQAKRLRLPGEPRLVVLYGPYQYPLARAIANKYKDAELWYVASSLPSDATDHPRLADFDQLARRDAARTVRIDAPEDTELLRHRMAELQIISERPFTPRRRRLGRKAKPASG